MPRLRRVFSLTCYHFDMVKTNWLLGSEKNTVLALLLKRSHDEPVKFFFCILRPRTWNSLPRLLGKTDIGHLLMLQVLHDFLSKALLLLLSVDFDIMQSISLVFRGLRKDRLMLGCSLLLRQFVLQTGLLLLDVPEAKLEMVLAFDCISCAHLRRFFERLSTLLLLLFLHTALLADELRLILNLCDNISIAPLHTCVRLNQAALASGGDKFAPTCRRYLLLLRLRIFGRVRLVAHSAFGFFFGPATWLRSSTTIRRRWLVCLVGAVLLELAISEVLVIHKPRGGGVGFLECALKLFLLSFLVNTEQKATNERLNHYCGANFDSSSLRLFLAKIALNEPFYLSRAIFH